MMHLAWKLSSNHPASEPLRRVVAFVFVMLALVASPNGMRAADEPSGPFLFASRNQTGNDLEIEIKVRRALRQDAKLRPLNLGVHMSGGIATLSGPVPTAELKQRAIAITEHVTGVLAVRSKDLYVSASETNGKRLSIVVQEEGPTQTRSASPGSQIVDRPIAPRLHSDSRSGSAPSGTGQQITLLAPEMVAPSPLVPEAARLTANPHPAPAAATIATALEQLRRRDTRYQQIRTSMQGTTVYVYPSGTASEDVMRFAQVVRRLPGVQHVVLSSNPR